MNESDDYIILDGHGQQLCLISLNWTCKANLTVRQYNIKEI